MMVKRTSNSPYIPPQPSAPPMPEHGFGPYVPSASPLPWGLDQAGGQRAHSPSRSSAGVASSPLGGLATMRLNGGSAGTASMRRGQLPPTPSRPPVAQNLQDLPAKALQNMASFLDPRSRQALSVVSKTMNEAAWSSQTHMQVRDKKMLNRLHHYPNLQSLRLRGNITLDELKALPKTLRHLDLSECDANSGAKSHAAIEYLTTVSPVTRTVPFPHLESLNVKGARLGDHGAELLAGMSSLKTLNVADGGISEVGAKKLADHKSLESLDMSGNRIDARGAQHLAASESIKTLRLCCCGVTDPGIHALASNPRLTSLDVSGNYIGDEALHALAASPSLAELDVSCNRPFTTIPLGQRVTEAGEMAVALAMGLLKRETPLVSLKADGNYFDDTAAEMLAYPPNGTLSLSLKSNLIEAAGAQKLAENPILKSLDLTQNKIDDAGVEALASSRSLRELVVRNCRVTDTGVAALASNRTLTSLDLGNLVTETGNEAEQAGYDETANEISDEGARLLGQNRTLTSLSIQGNLCGDAGVLELAKNRTLTSLNVAFTNMTPVSTPELARNPVLTSLNVRWNYDLGDADMVALAKSQSLTFLDARDTSMGEEGAKALEANIRLTGTPDDPNFISKSYREPD
uniref:RipG7 n=2 Tax=Ralstonia solanacearum species complex TaxID=3116862 RepID=A0A0M4FLU2_RALSL|nr:RipG7 [Ralstonia solanacearum]